MKINIFQDALSNKNGATGYLYTLDMPVVPRIGEHIQIAFAFPKDGKHLGKYVIKDIIYRLSDNSDSFYIDVHVK